MRLIIKKYLKVILPSALYRFFSKVWIYVITIQVLTTTYLYDLKRYHKYSDLLSIDSSQKLVGRIIREYHVIEKGLTMPESRFGFGKEILLKLCDDCLVYMKKYSTDEEQVMHAIGVLFEYKKFHEIHNFKLDEEVIDAIGRVSKQSFTITNTAQKEMTRDEYFKYVDYSFPEFANSRASVRNYLDLDVSVNSLIQALEIAKTTPSACNRQCWRTYIFKEKDQINKILQVQGGNRGFGHLTNKLIVIAAEVGVFTGVAERNQAFIDGGMYAMNLLYSLHSQKIAACILNCSNTVEKDIRLRELCNIEDSEVFIAMIACGIPPDEFKVAASKRYKLLNTNKII